MPVLLDFERTRGLLRDKMSTLMDNVARTLGESNFSFSRATSLTGQQCDISRRSELPSISALERLLDLALRAAVAKLRPLDTPRTRPYICRSTFSAPVNDTKLFTSFQLRGGH